MSLQNLIASERATQNAALSALNTSNAAYLSSLIAAASGAIRRYCLRDFTSTQYSEYYSGGIYVREPLKLRQFPVTQIQEIATANRAVQVLNSGAGGIVQKATVETLANGNLQLYTWASGVQSAAQVIDISVNKTVQAAMNAINALGNGWSTAIYSGAVGSYNLFPAADLKPLQGAASAMVGGCYLEIYEQWYGWNSVAFWPDEHYELGAVAPFWRLDDETGEIWGHLPRGFMNLRIKYTAGFATIPQEVQEACVQHALDLYNFSQANQALKSARIDGYEFTNFGNLEMSSKVRGLLSTYRDYSRTIYRG